MCAFINDEDDPCKDHDFKAVPYDITSRERDDIFWTSWLPKELSQRLDKIKEIIRKKYTEHDGKYTLKWYTSHGVDHCEAVEDYLHKLIPGCHYRSLSEHERFLLLASTWIHDIGLLKILKNDYSLSDDEIREDHHIRAEKFIAENYASLGLKEEEASVVGMIARFHRRKVSINNCKKTADIKSCTVRPRLLASYLRLADALHMDQTRAADIKYAIALTYNIPYHTKLHWLKSKFVLGVKPDINTKELVVHLKYPLNLNDKAIQRKVKNIFESSIIGDLREELDSISSVLTEESITYFLSVKQIIHKVEFPEQLLNDICTVLDERMLLQHPSSSSLYKTVIHTLNTIVNENNNSKKSIQNVERFIKNVKDNILYTRSSHLGLTRVLKELNDAIKGFKLPSKQLTEIKKRITEYETSINRNKRKVRYNSKKYFSTAISDFSMQINNDITKIVKHINSNPTFVKEKVARKDENDCENENDLCNSMEKTIKECCRLVEHKIGFLLYGHSEYAIRALCGFRDAVIDCILREIVKEIDTHSSYFEYYKISLEKIASLFFDIFICEGQPKNQNKWGRKTIYHDGWEYSCSLINKDFVNVNLIPDAISGTLLETISNDNQPLIHYVLLGANGFNDEQFVHSAGHKTIIQCCNYSNLHNDQPQDDGSTKVDGSPKDDGSTKIRARTNIILVTTTLKYLSEEQLKKEHDGKNIFLKQYMQNEFGEVHYKDNSWKIRSIIKDEAIRKTIFIPHDTRYFGLDDENIKGPSIYNPRDDIISFSDIHTIITEKKSYEVETIIKSIGKDKGDKIRIGKFLFDDPEENKENDQEE